MSICNTFHDTSVAERYRYLNRTDRYSPGIYLRELPAAIVAVGRCMSLREGGALLFCTARIRSHSPCGGHTIRHQAVPVGRKKLSDLIHL